MRKSLKRPLCVSAEETPPQTQHCRPDTCPVKDVATFLHFLFVVDTGRSLFCDFWGWSDFLTYCVIGPIIICLKHFRELIHLNVFLTDCWYFIMHLFCCICQITYFNYQIPESFRSTLLHVHICGWVLRICCRGWRFMILKAIQWSFELWCVLPLLD